MSLEAFGDEGNIGVCGECRLEAMDCTCPAGPYEDEGEVLDFDEPGYWDC